MLNTRNVQVGLSKMKKTIVFTDAPAVKNPTESSPPQ